ncbi:MAG: penicillin-binding transpeptidase domain-containing protein [Oscillospiraceae bacterium]
MKKNNTESKLLTSKIRKRMTIVVGVIVVCFCVVVAVVAKVALLDHEKYKELAIAQQLRDTKLSAKRGTIYDRNMNILAQSATVWTVALSPMDLKEEDFEIVSRGLSEILGVSYDTVLAKCSEKNYYSIVKRKVDQVVVDKIRVFMNENKINGISFTEDSKRYYPYGNFAAQVLGFVGTDNQGLAGLEYYYDSYLSGTEGRLLTLKNAVGSDMYYQYETIYEAKEGYSLVLTIDEVIQHYLEKHLEAAYKEHNVKNRATGIVMNVKTGEILAMCTKPDFDPNDPLTIYDPDSAAAVEALAGTDGYYAALGEAQKLQWNNKAISEIYEPGSVFKVVTASAALETGAVDLNTSFYCKGYYQVTPQVSMSCARTSGHGAESFVQAVINSCNPAFIDIGMRLGKENFANYFKAFGLMEKTGIDLPGEAISEFYTADRMSVVNLASCAFGQSNAITPIQLITAVSAAVNGGYLVKPYMVKEVLDGESNIVEQHDPFVKRQVISAETSKLMADIMEQVVMKANGQNAYVAGFRIGGKSGTSQKLDLGEGSGKYVASFCAIAPADDPEIAVIIILDEPNSRVSIYGGVIAAPVAGSIMADVLPYIGIEPVYTDSESEFADVSTPGVVGLPLSNAYAQLQIDWLTYNVVGSGDTVVSQYPLAGQSIPKGSTVVLYTESDATRTATVPDLAGRSIESARAVLKSMGLNLKVSGAMTGSAVVLSQSYLPGTSVSAGTVVTAECINKQLDE